MAQKLIIFENILNGDALLESKEIKALCNHQLGGSKLSLGETDKIEEFHDWLNDELQKAISSEYCQVYGMKAPFADIKGTDESGEYSAPVRVFLFEPDAATDDGILLLTCYWKGSIFSNDHYVCGVVANEDDLVRMLDGKVGGKLIGADDATAEAPKETPDSSKMTTKEIVQYFNDLTKKADNARSFDELEELDDEKREFWNNLDDKTKQLKTIVAAKKKYDDKSFVMSIVLANR